MIKAASRTQDRVGSVEGNKWSLESKGACGIDSFMRPCQTDTRSAAEAASAPISRICETKSEMVFVVDDEVEIRENLVELIQSFGFPALGCESAAELQASVAGVSSGCILLDVRLPGLDGIAAQDWLSKAGINLPIIFISGIRDVSTAVQGLKGGAIEFLEKPFSELVLRRAVISGVGLSRQRHCRKESERFVRGLVDKLTPTELYVAGMIAKGYPTKMIAAEMGRSENTLKIHRHRIFTKFQVNSAASVANIMNFIDSERKPVFVFS